MTAPNDVSEQVAAALRDRLPDHATIESAYDDEVKAWTWNVFVPTPTEENPDARQGVSRQYVLPQGTSTPDQSVLDGMVIEIVNTLGAATA